jgi:hypothetical protein
MLCRSYSLPAWESTDPLAAAGIGQLLATAGVHGNLRVLYVAGLAAPFISNASASCSCNTVYLNPP